MSLRRCSTAGRTSIVLVLLLGLQTRQQCFLALLELVAHLLRPLLGLFDQCLQLYTARTAPVASATAGTAARSPRQQLAHLGRRLAVALEEALHVDGVFRSVACASVFVVACALPPCHRNVPHRDRESPQSTCLSRAVPPRREARRSHIQAPRRHPIAAT